MRKAGVLPSSVEIEKMTIGVSDKCASGYWGLRAIRHNLESLFENARAVSGTGARYV